jgi:hypothetical protein
MRGAAFLKQRANLRVLSASFFVAKSHPKNERSQGVHMSRRVSFRQIPYSE